MKSEEHSTAAMSAKSIAPMEKIDILENLKSGSSALMGESAKRKQENPRNANLAAWYSFDPSNIWWLMDGVKHPQSRAPSAGLKKLSCCFRFIWQSARGKQVFTMLNCCQHLVSLPNLILDALCRHPGVLSSSERPGHRRGCHLYEHPPLSWLHITSILRILMGRHITYTDGQYIKSTGSTCAPCVLNQPEWS